MPEYDIKLIYNKKQDVYYYKDVVKSECKITALKHAKKKLLKYPTNYSSTMNIVASGVRLKSNKK